MKIRFLRPFYGMLCVCYLQQGIDDSLKLKNAKKLQITKLARQMFHVKQRKRGANVDFCSKSIRKNDKLTNNI